jgi:hypothetical protein
VPLTSPPIAHPPHLLPRAPAPNPAARSSTHAARAAPVSDQTRSWDLGTAPYLLPPLRSSKLALAINLTRRPLHNARQVCAVCSLIRALALASHHPLACLWSPLAAVGLQPPTHAFSSLISPKHVCLGSTRLNRIHHSSIRRHTPLLLPLLLPRLPDRPSPPGTSGCPHALPMPCPCPAPTLSARSPRPHDPDGLVTAAHPLARHDSVVAGPTPPGILARAETF